MKPTETSATAARAAHAKAPTGPGAGTASDAAAGDAFAALLEGLCPDGGEAQALPGAAPAEDAALPTKGRKAPAAPDSALPDAFFPSLPQGVAPPLNVAMASPATAAGSLRDAAGADGTKGTAAAGRAAPAADDMQFGGTEAPVARPGAFQALLAASASATASAQAAPADPASPLLVPDALAAGLPPGLTGAHTAPALDAAAASSPVHQATLAAHPQSPAFASELGTELRWMVDAGLQQAELHLNPAELGPIQVQLTLQAQTTDIHFAAAHAATRESIQQALPVLREMLAGEGLQLGQAGVSGGDAGQAFAQPQPQPQPQERSTGAPGAAAGDKAVAALASAAPRAGRGMLDLYA